MINLEKPMRYNKIQRMKLSILCVSSTPPLAKTINQVYFFSKHYTS